MDIASCLQRTVWCCYGTLHMIYWYIESFNIGRWIHVQGFCRRSGIIFSWSFFTLPSLQLYFCSLVYRLFMVLSSTLRLRKWRKVRGDIVEVTTWICADTEILQNVVILFRFLISILLVLTVLQYKVWVPCWSELAVLCICLVLNTVPVFILNYSG